eukprot:SAG25_NODE_3163_length_1189_cov_2.631193_2_plen_165_part_00
MELVESLSGTHLDLKMYVPLLVKYQMAGGKYPLSHATRYMHEEQLGRADLALLDAENRERLAEYTANVHRMEEITRLNVNLALLRMHAEKAAAAGGQREPLRAEVLVLRLGDVVLTTCAVAAPPIFCAASASVTTDFSSRSRQTPHARCVLPAGAGGDNGIAKM